MSKTQRLLAVSTCFLVATISCYWIATSYAPVLGSVAFSIALGVQSRLMVAARHETLSPSHRMIGAIFAVAIISLLVWLSLSGRALAHNEWFRRWSFRAEFAVVVWLCYAIPSLLAMVRQAKVGPQETPLTKS